MLSVVGYSFAPHLQGFGAGNFKALFESIEREQVRARLFANRSSTLRCQAERGNLEHTKKAGAAAPAEAAKAH